jgi:hypothetical protein
MKLKKSFVGNGTLITTIEQLLELLLSRAKAHKQNKEHFNGWLACALESLDLFDIITNTQGRLLRKHLEEFRDQ